MIFLSSAAGAGASFTVYGSENGVSGAGGGASEDNITVVTDGTAVV